MKKKLLDSMKYCATVSVSLGLVCAASASSDRTVITRFNGSSNDINAQVLISSLNAQVLWKSELVEGLCILSCPSGDGPHAVDVLSASSFVKYAELSTSLSTTSCSGIGTRYSLQGENIPNLQWAAENQGQKVAGVFGTLGEDMNLKLAWGISIGDPSVLVTVVDPLGVDIDHPSLVNSVWHNPHEIAGDGIDNDTNGYVDDISGLNFGDPTQMGVVTNDPRPGQNGQGAQWSHGTACASLIFGDHVLNGVHGVAPKCKLLSIRLWSGINWDHDDMAARLITALEYSLKVGSQISSWSFEIIPINGLEDMIYQAESRGHIIVCAAGNAARNIDQIPFYAASYSLNHKNVIAIAAVDNHGCLAEYIDNQGSDWGVNTVQIAAPGWQNVAATRLITGSTQLYDWFDGTSAATPHVAGALALLRCVNPSLSISEMRDRLSQTGKPHSSLSGKTISGKTVDAYALIHY